MNLVYLKTIPQRDQSIRTQLFHENGTCLGEIEAGVDGFYYFWPSLKEGCWSAAVLREITNLLELY